MREKSKFSPERTKIEKRQKTRGKEQGRHAGIKIKGKRGTGKTKRAEPKFLQEL